MAQVLHIRRGNAIKDHTLHASTQMPRTTLGIWLNVTVTGNLVLQGWDAGANDATMGLAVGTHFIEGNWKLAKSFSGTLSPASTVHPVYIESESHT